MGGNNLAHFKIVRSTGLISTTTSLDYERLPSYNLTVQASDTKYNTIVQVIVNVTNVNDNRPKFTENPYIATVKEDAKLLTSVKKVSASDVDDFGRISYSIVSGSNKFSIDPTTGVITTTDALDRETQDRYEFTVVATDGGSPPMSARANFTLTVLDVNDNPPVILPRAHAVSIREDAAVGTSVANLTATDNDIGINAQVTYNISYESVPDAFLIDTNTGLITTKTKLDAEQIRNYHLRCEATDQGDPRLTSIPVVIDISVEDVNDNSPIFRPAAYHVEVNENVAIGTIVKEVLATDADSGSNGKVVYSIMQEGDWGLFVIEPSTGKFFCLLPKLFNAIFP